ncbi:SET domain-containing protein 8 [Tolypocladium ophioglossoides CBS 100239]|uniref:SET domain-containing protein 8 n=1 Tax=Tolypocladium ophioglossoides (strain CBS 100239) TaxID=1163406 RepID=A0A0L0MYU3_TOLOC|nr:SET domain-containing protein 8 [Tolypocladium ophioglossoides CBS 100239]
MSSSSQLPLDAFPAWVRLNGVAFTDVKLQDVDGKGFGLVANTELGNQETGTNALIEIPRDLVLSAEAVEEYAKVDQNFKQLLEAVALDAKLSALANEFDELREATKALPFWNSILWEQNTASVDDWVLADAWYRSRCLELPQIGAAMVPGLDMVNHSSRPTAYYEVNGSNDVALLMRPGCTASRGQEVTISYGESKSAAEMLFSYGFIDSDRTARELTLHLEPFPDDPLAKAKLHVFNGLPTEDGLEFRLQQDTMGKRQLRLLWQGDDVTERAADFEALIRGHDLCEVFKLRAVAVLHERVEIQLTSIKGGPSEDQLQQLAAAGLLKDEFVEAARVLKEVEGQKSILLAHDHVAAYLGSTEVAQNGQGPRLSSPNEDGDFS